MVKVWIKGKKNKECREEKRDTEIYSGSPIGTSTPFTPFEGIHYVRIFVTSNLIPRPPNNLSNIQHRESTPLSLKTTCFHKLGKQATIQSYWIWLQVWVQEILDITICFSQYNNSEWINYKCSETFIDMKVCIKVSKSFVKIVQRIVMRKVNEKW